MCALNIALVLEENIVFSIENQYLKAEFKALGAELCSLKDKNTGTEYIWQGQEDIWNRHAPVLFPFVGSLLNGSYSLNGQEYFIEHHGFARDLPFQGYEKDGHYINFRLKANAYTLKRYPFEFELQISYRLEGHMLLQSFTVINLSNQKMPYSIGGHPAFNASPIDAFEIEFERSELHDSQILENGIIGYDKMEAINGKKIMLTSNIFNKDAFILTKLKSNRFHLRNRQEDRTILTVDKGNFPHFGIWSKPNAPFVCLEPWQGTSDYAGSRRDVFDKYGIIGLNPGESKRHFFSISIHP